MSTYALMGSKGLSACRGYVSALLMIFCVSYNMKPPKITNPPYVAIDWRPAPTTEVAGRNSVPGIKQKKTVNLFTWNTLLNSTLLTYKSIK